MVGHHWRTEGNAEPDQGLWQISAFTTKARHGQREERVIWRRCDHKNLPPQGEEK
jgi:hypothetical protein